MISNMAKIELYVKAVQSSSRDMLKIGALLSRSDLSTFAVEIHRNSR
ncbi:MAG: hypothetical protein ACE14P_11145 [Methanotrichaceae archaeon]